VNSLGTCVPLCAGVDKHDNLIGRLMYVEAGEQLTDLGEKLVDAGLAKVLITRH